MIRRSTNICQLLCHHLKEWKEDKFESLECDAEQCARQFTRPRKKGDKDHTVAVFTCLMLRGQVRSAIRIITDRVSGGGVLSLDSSSVTCSAKTVPFSTFGTSRNTILKY